MTGLRVSRLARVEDGGPGICASQRDMYKRAFNEENVSKPSRPPSVITLRCPLSVMHEVSLRRRFAIGV